MHGSFVKVKEYWLEGIRLSRMAADDGRECSTTVMAVGYGKAYWGDVSEQAHSL